MNAYRLSALVTALGFCSGLACSPSDGVERQQTGGSANGGSGGAAAGGAGSGGAGTGGGGTSGGSSGSGGAAGSTASAAGTAGTGGSAGSEMGGSGGGGAGTGGSPGVGCTGTELFCEDFEDDADGMAPGAPWLALDEYCADQFTTEVTTELAHDSSKAFKATKSRAANCRSSAPFPEVDDFWLRAFIYWDPSVDFNALEVLALDLTGPTQLKSDDPALRFGTRMKTPCEASGGPQITITGLAGGEQTGCSGDVQEPKGEWFCFEAHVNQASELKVKTYINGQGFTYESSGKAASETIETPAGTPLVTKVNHVRLGIFSTPSPVTGSVYIDDIAIATTRLGCGG